MDHGTRRIEYSAAVPPDWGFALGSVLRSESGEGRESAIDASDRRAVHTDAVLRGPKDEMVAPRTGIWHQCETGAADYATNGSCRHLPQATAVETGARTSDLSVPTQRNADRPSKPGLDERHHLYSVAARIHLSGRGHGLVQPIRLGVGSIGFVGDVILRGRTRLGSTARPARDLQYRPGSAVHQRGLHEPVEGAWDRHQHGRARSRHRQHLHRTSVANGEIRRGLSEGLPGRAGSAVESQKLFCFLQSRTTASSAGLPNAGDGSFSSEEAKTGDAGSRPARRSSPINGPGPKRFGRTDRIFTKKEKSSKKERKLRKGRPVETAASVEKKQTASLLFSHSRLDKTERKTCSVLSTVPTGPNLHSLYMELQGTNRNGVFRIYGAYGKYGNPRKNARITTLSTSPKTALAAG